MTVSESPAKPGFRWPSDYYSLATPNRVLPQWAPFGCGAVAIVVLVIVFAGGAFLSSGGFTDFMDFAIGMSVSEMKGQYANDVSAAQKKSLDEEIERMRKNLREGRIALPAIQPFLELLRQAASDKKITVEETANLEGIVRRINTSAKPAKRV